VGESVRIFYFTDLPKFLFGFSIFSLKSRGLSVLVFLGGLSVFYNLVFSFRFLPTMVVVFPIFLPNEFCSFSGFAKEVTPRSRTKTVIPRDHLHDKPCVFRHIGLPSRK